MIDFLLRYGLDSIRILHCFRQWTCMQHLHKSGSLNIGFYSKKNAFAMYYLPVVVWPCEYTNIALSSTLSLVVIFLQNRFVWYGISIKKECSCSWTISLLRYGHDNIRILHCNWQWAYVQYLGKVGSLHMCFQRKNNSFAPDYLSVEVWLCKCKNIALPSIMILCVIFVQNRFVGYAISIKKRKRMLLPRDYMSVEVQLWQYILHECCIVINNELGCSFRAKSVH